MATIPLPTFFAPAERATEQELRAQNTRVASLDLVRLLLDSFPEGAVVLNSQRQIVFANDKVASFLSTPRDALVGLRPGEALGCLHARDLPAGCGTTEACRHCGAVQALETSRLNQSREVQECRILRTGPAACPALELRVWAVPLELEGERFTILALRDISDEKRRQLLERIFFHDVMNLAGGLRGLLGLLPELSGAEAIEFERLAMNQVDQMIEEIECQRDLASAEQGELTVRLEPVKISELLDRLCHLYRHHPVAQGKTLDAQACSADDTLLTDPILLRRVLGNLIKNALEASRPGEKVTVRATADPKGHVFSVNNPAVLTEAVRAQMFQRSFSTKGGKGRGLGSYSVKMLTERYLLGQVEFDSTPERGTTFRIRLPHRASPAQRPDGLPTTAASQQVAGADDDQDLVGTCILLAEDNKVNQQLVSGVLRKKGVQVQVVSNGVEAVEAVRTRPFDAVLMDAEMPEMDGFEATAAIRDLERRTGGHVPIVALTAHASEEARQLSLAAGMDEHLTKPLAAHQLLSTLRRFRRERVSPRANPGPVEGADSPPPALSPVAVARLRALTGAAPEMLSELVKAFLHDVDDRQGRLHQAFEADDADQVRQNAHGLKGACIEFGAQHVIPICQELEDRGHTRSLTGAKDLFLRLDREVERARIEVATLLLGETS